MASQAAREGGKRAARAAAKEALRALAGQAGALEREATAVQRAVQRAGWWRGAATVGLYCHCERLLEVRTSALLAAALAAGKRLFVPQVVDRHGGMRFLHLADPAELRAAPPFGIPEPGPRYPDGRPREELLGSGRELDVLVMPGLAFDAGGRRLGRGGGYYDAFLEQYLRAARDAGRRRPLLVALAYSAQVIDAVPVEAHDIAVDVLVTGTGVFAGPGCPEGVDLPEVDGEPGT